MKRILSVLFALCLAVGCLPSYVDAADVSSTIHYAGDPAQSAALSSTEQRELESFLTTFAFWGSSYDSKDVLHSLNNATGLNIMESMVTGPHYHFYYDALYPGEKAAYQLDGADPLNRFANHFPSWSKISLERVEWILGNIFNVSQSDISQMERGLLEKDPNTLYLLDGYYYFLDGGIGWGGYIQDLDVELNGNLYTATYIVKSYDRFQGQYQAVVERKTIDGAAYWTLHSVTVSEEFSTTVNQEKGGKSTTIQSVDGGMRITTENARGRIMSNVSVPGNPGPAMAFSDVKAGDWYKHDVDAVTGLKLFTGTSATRFSPNATMTRGMLATVLYRLSGEVDYGVGSGMFVDVPDTWYTDAVEWAQATGIVTGEGDGKFNPDGRVTREQLVTMLYRYAKLIGRGGWDGATLYDFPDYWKVSSYAEEAMSWAVAKRFIQGRDGYLAPKGNATRAEVAAILNRFVDYLSSESSKSHWIPCIRCGQYYDYLILERVCANCEERCLNCGTSVEYRGAIDGYCEDCYKKLFS